MLYPSWLYTAAVPKRCVSKQSVRISLRELFIPLDIHISLPSLATAHPPRQSTVVPITGKRRFSLPVFIAVAARVCLCISFAAPLVTLPRRHCWKTFSSVASGRLAVQHHAFPFVYSLCKSPSPSRVRCILRLRLSVGNIVPSLSRLPCASRRRFCVFAATVRCGCESSSS